MLDANRDSQECAITDFQLHLIHQSLLCIKIQSK